MGGLEPGDAGGPVVRILGPVLVGDEAPDLGDRARALLGLLVLHRNTPVRAEVLVEELWDGSPPPTARSALRTHVASVRRCLAQVGLLDRLVSHDGAYGLTLQPGELDVDRALDLQALAQAARATGRPDLAAERAGTALSMWRGEPMADVPDLIALEPEVSRIQRLELAIREERADDLIALGREAEVLGELEVLAVRHPLRERFTAQLMVTLYRAGRQSDALRAYADLRRRLAEELGVSPSPELRHLELRILDHDSTLLAVRDGDGIDSISRRPRLRTSVAHAAEPIGREHESAVARRRMAAAGSRGAAVIVVEGPAGIGKTTFAAALAREAYDRGAAVLWGDCPRVHATIFQPLHEVVEALRTDPAFAALDPFGSVAASDPAAARHQLVARLARVLEAAAGTRQLVVVVEDLHWADESTRALLWGIVRLGLPRGSTLLVTVRNDATGRAALDGLPSPNDATFVRLAPLSPQDVAALVAREHPDLGGYEAWAVQRRAIATAGGNPLLALVASRGPAGEGAVRLHGEHPVHPVVMARLAELSAGCRHTLALAAVVGQEFSVRDVADLGDRARPADVGAVLDHLGPALDAGLVRQIGPGRFAFEHDLLRTAFEEAMSPGERCRLHEVMARRHEARHEWDAAAVHMAAAVPIVAPEAAIGALRRAAEHVLRTGFERAMSLLTTALALLDEAPDVDPAVEIDLRCDLARAAAFAGDGRRARHEWKAAYRRALEVGDEERAVRAVVEPGEASHSLDGDPDQVDALESVLARFPTIDPATEALLRSEIALVRAYLGLSDEVRAHLERLRELASEHGGVCEARWLVTDLWTSIWDPDAPRRARLAAAVAARSDLPSRLTSFARAARFVSLAQLGDLEGAEHELAAIEAVAGDDARPAARWAAEVYRACLAWLRGDRDESVRRARSAWELGRRLSVPDADGAFALHQAWAEWTGGGAVTIRLGDGSGVKNHCVASGLQCLHALVLLRDGDPHDARRHLDEAVGRLLGAQPGVFWMPALCLAAAAIAAADAGDLAPEVHAALEPYRGLEAIAGLVAGFSFGAVDDHLARLAALIPPPPGGSS